MRVPGTFAIRQNLARIWDTAMQGVHLKRAENYFFVYDFVEERIDNSKDIAKEMQSVLSSGATTTKDKVKESSFFGKSYKFHCYVTRWHPLIAPWVFLFSKATHHSLVYPGKSSKIAFEIDGVESTDTISNAKDIVGIRDPLFMLAVDENRVVDILRDVNIRTTQIVLKLRVSAFKLSRGSADVGIHFSSKKEALAYKMIAA